MEGLYPIIVYILESRINNDAKLLDIGCGNGELICSLSNRLNIECLGIDISEKAESSKLDEVDVVEGISLASKSRASSAWQFVETEKGYVVRSAGGKYEDWIIVIDDSAKTRPEGPNLTVTPALRLAKNATANSYW